MPSITVMLRFPVRAVLYPGHAATFCFFIYNEYVSLAVVLFVSLYSVTLVELQVDILKNCKSTF